MFTSTTTKLAVKACEPQRENAMLHVRIIEEWFRDQLDTDTSSNKKTRDHGK